MKSRDTDFAPLGEVLGGALAEVEERSGLRPDLRHAHLGESLAHLHEAEKLIRDREVISDLREAKKLIEQAEQRLLERENA